MDYLKKKKIQYELDKISEQEWSEICTRCKSILKKKLYNKTAYGAHSETTLGVPAIDYYLNESIAKLYSFEWEWKFKEFDMVDQIIRVAFSMISNNVDKYRRRNENGYVEAEFHENFIYDIFDEVYDEGLDLFLACIDRIVKEDDLLEIYWESIKEGLKSSEIAEIIEKPVKYVYRQNDKLIYHAKTKCLNKNGYES